MIAVQRIQPMADQIVTITDIQRRARAAFQAGQAADSCPFNWHSAAYVTWNDEYRRLSDQAAQQTLRRAA